MKSSIHPLAVATVVGLSALLTAAQASAKHAVWPRIPGTIAFTTRTDGFAGPLFTTDADGSHRTRLFGGLNVRPRWSPDGSSLLFTRVSRASFSGDVFVLTSKRTLIRVARHATDPMWSPDSHVIYFARQGSWWSFELASHHAKKVGPAQGLWSDLARDGVRVAFQADRGIGIASLGKRMVRKLTSGEDLTPSWSPNGKKIAFARSEFGLGNISPGTSLYFANAQTGSLTQLTDGSAQDLSPRWAPDGKRIVFVRGDLSAHPYAAGIEVFVMNADGSGTHAITHNAV